MSWIATKSKSGTNSISTLIMSILSRATCVSFLLTLACPATSFLPSFQKHRHFDHYYRCLPHATRSDDVPTSLLSSSSSRQLAATTNGQAENLWDELSLRFQGDFDNYNQVVEDRQEGLLPREGGGHEHIHCCLVPVTKETRLAAFYFDGNPSAIFRFRFYKLVPGMKGEGDVNDNSNTVDTVLYTLDPELERMFRECPNPLQWVTIFEEQNGQERVTELKDCDIRWSWTLDPVQHAYAVSHHHQSRNKNDAGIHAVMVHGEALVESQMMPGVQILIRDQLSLWEDEFWIHDRGFEPATMKYIYGNQREKPYRLERVANMQRTSSSALTERKIVNDDLSWTLGPDFRSPETYDDKLSQVGGPSQPQRR